MKIHYGTRLYFSVKPGYYDSAFYLSILGGGKNTVHYTLDGNEPTTDDPVFDRNAPLYIEDATNQPNVYSMRTDTSTGFLEDLVSQYSGGATGFTSPAYSVDKCTIIRASLFDDAGNRLDSITGSYFVGFQGKAAFRNLYTVSLVTSPENLFDADSGIYVTGNRFQQFLKEEIIQEDLWFRPYWWWWTANYSNRGMDWERAAHMTVFDDRQNILLSQHCGIRIKGGGSRGKLPKSLSCYARESYTGSNRFDTDIFQANMFPHKIVLFAGGDDNLFKLKDYLANTMEQDLHFATMDFIPCALFLDGEYWGMYYLTEDYNAEYIHDHYQIDNDNSIIIKNNTLAVGNEEDYQTYLDMLTFIREQDMTDMAQYDQACSLLDIDSYIDYYAAQIYIARNNDWPGGNYALWRARENDGSRYGDTKWRWMLFDVNSGGLGGYCLSDDTLLYVLSKDAAFSSLYQNETFRRKFAERILYIGKEIFAPEKCDQFINDYVQTLKEPLAASNKRFYMDEKNEEFEQYVADIKTFFNERYDIVWNSLVENMGEEWLSQNGIQK